MNKLAWFAVLAAAILAVGLGALAYRWQPTGLAPTQVTIANYAFSPASLTVDSGTTVRWTNMDMVGHTVTPGGQGATMGMGSAMMGHMATYSYTFMESGTYEYHCEPHPYMTGTVVVTP